MLRQLFCCYILKRVGRNRVQSLSLSLLRAHCCNWETESAKQSTQSERIFLNDKNRTDISQTARSLITSAATWLARYIRWTEWLNATLLWARADSNGWASFSSRQSMHLATHINDTTNPNWLIRFSRKRLAHYRIPSERPELPANLRGPTQYDISCPLELKAVKCWKKWEIFLFF